MNIETGKDIYGRAFEFMRCGLVKGRNLLVANGYIQCQNPVYYKNESEHWHFNHKMKTWLKEEKRGV